MGFQLTINDVSKADAFALIFQHMKLFTDQVLLMFSAEKLFIQAMDNAHVCVFEVALDAAWFTSYQFEENQSGISIGLLSSILFRILSARDKGQLLEIRYDNDEDDKLFIHFTGDNPSVFDKQFEMPLMDIDMELLDIPTLEYTAEFVLASANFANIINQMKMFGDNMDFQCSEEQIALSSNSLDTGKMSVQIKIDDLTEFSINEWETVSLSFSLAYMHHICMYNKIAKQVEIKLTNEFPMKMTYSLGENAYLMFYLAPKMAD